MNTERCGRKQLWHNHDTILEFARWDLKIITNSSVRVASNWQTDWLSKSAERSPWEANSSSSNWGIPHILWNLKAHYHVHKSLPFVPILSQMHPVHTLQFYFINVHFKIMRPSVPRSSTWFPSLSPHISFQRWEGCKFHLLPGTGEFEIRGTINCIHWVQFKEASTEALNFMSRHDVLTSLSNL